MNYIVLDKNGQHVRHGQCAAADFSLQADHSLGQTMIEGTIDDTRQKIVNGRIVNKTPREIETDRLPEPDAEDLPRFLSIKEYQTILARLDTLEAR